MLTRKKLQTNILLIVVITILINLIAAKLFFRLDFTDDQRYSLSNATENILKNLNQPVTVKAYFSENLPPDVEKVRSDFRDLLIEYSNYSDDNVVYEFINPNEDQQTETEAQQAGIRPIMINVRERDQVKQQRAYLGAIVQLGSKKEVIPFIQPGAAMEFALSSNIKKLTNENKPKVGFLQGFGTPSLTELQQANEQLQVLYDVKPFEFSDTANIPNDYKAILVVAPTDSIPTRYFDQLDNYLESGGRLLLALNSVKGDLSTAQGSELNTGFESWLRNKGIDIQNNFVIDANCSNVMVRQQQGMFVMNTPVQFPYLPIINSFGKNPITEGLESVVLPFASEIKIEPKDTSIYIYPIATTSKKSGTVNPPLYFDVNKNWTGVDFMQSSIPVAIIADGKLVGNTESKMIVISDGDFIVNGEGQSAQKLQDDNVNLFVNSVDWLADDTGLIDLRTKGITSRPIDASIEDGTKTLLKYLNFILPLLLVVFIGIYRWQLKKRNKNKLMNTHYA
ncbi:MAG: Gldg family protein [Bacteroidetes bacterium]|nr:Gldg family protein [Bacteroidota bacterium]MBU1114515.1 Gldg family protein [Bacteroidota bacterium]MBU1799699.1 Gldg family protein [Bacteroidota bacterium]